MSSTAAVGTSERPSVLPYALTIFLSAFLLFLVQPIIAKQILPWFGGSSGVWTTALVFFQSTLLAGYAYADWTTRLGVRRQTTLHVVLLAVSLLSLPILASTSWKPHGDEEPTLRILLLLTATIGLPYFLLSTTTPLLQSWYWRRFRSAVPYRLFALSNFASLLALLGFPILLEPWFDLVALGWGWSALYIVFVGVCAATGWASLRAAAATEGDPVQASASAPAAAAPPAVRTQLTWLALSAMGSVMLLAVTNHVTQNIASVPFLWVLPLSIYLLTFILTFDHPRWYQRWFFVVALAGLVPAMAWLIPSLDLKLAVTVFFVGLFVACMFCHGELARMKPDPRYLTRFYLMLSVGGALGAVLVAIVAPLTLPGYFEVNVALVLLALLLLVQLGGWTRLVGVAVVAATGWFAVQGAQEYARDTRVMWRDFYGVVRTRDRNEPVPYRSMLHGGIVHGGQLLGDAVQEHAERLLRPGLGLRAPVRRAERAPPGAAQRRDHRAGRRRGRVVRPRGRHLRLLRDQPARGRRGGRRVHLPEGHAGEDRCRPRRRPPQPRARGAPPVRRARHRRVRGRLDPDAPGDARGDGALRAPPRRRRRDRVPGNQPVHRPAARGEASRQRVRARGGGRVRPARITRPAPSTGCPRPTRSS